MPRTRHNSIGEMISSLCFFGVGLWLIGESLINPPLIKQALLFICGVFSLMAAFRFQIGKLAMTLSQEDD